MAKGILPYRGLGSGIKRALEDWPDISFTDDRDGCLFTVVVRRKLQMNAKGKLASQRKAGGSEKSSEKSSEKILTLLRDNPGRSAREMANALDLSPRAVEKQIAKLRTEGRIRRIGPDKGGRWEVL